MRIWDSRSPGAGILAAQHQDYDAPPSGQASQLSMRAAILVCRVRDRLAEGGRIGQFILPLEDHGDLIGLGDWRRGTGAGARPLSPWSSVWPAIVVHEDGPEAWGRPGGRHRALTVFRPDPGAGGIWVPDRRLADLAFDVAREADAGGSPQDAHPWPARGMHGLVVYGTDERRQYELWHRTDPRLIVPLRDGGTKYGEIVADMTAEQVETERRARLSSVLVVGGRVGGWQAAICGVQNPRGGGGHAAFVLRPDGGQSAVPGSVAYATALGAWEAGGPFHPGHGSSDRHKIGSDPDGNAVNPLHIWAGALYYRDREKDGPFELLDAWREGTGGPVKRAFRAWDPGTGQWRIQAHGDIFPPPSPPTEGPPVEGPPRTPVTWPTDKIAPEPGRYPFELRVPSLFLDGSRTNKEGLYDGRLGPISPSGEAVGVDGATQRDRQIVGHIWAQGSREIVGERWMGGELPRDTHCVAIGPSTEVPDAGDDFIPLPPVDRQAQREQFALHVRGRSLTVGTHGEIAEGGHTGALSIGVTGGGDQGLIGFTDGNGSIDPAGVVIVEGNLEVTGKLTVSGMIDPTGLQLAGQASAPVDPNTSAPYPDTIWIDNTNPSQSELKWRDDQGVDHTLAPASGGGGTPAVYSIEAPSVGSPAPALEVIFTSMPPAVGTPTGWAIYDPGSRLSTPAIGRAGLELEYNGVSSLGGEVSAGVYHTTHAVGSAETYYCWPHWMRRVSGEGAGHAALTIFEDPTNAAAKLATIGVMSWSGLPTNVLIESILWSSSTVVSSFTTLDSNGFAWRYMRVRKSPSNVIVVGLSVDGFSWREFSPQSLGFTPTRVGFTVRLYDAAGVTKTGRFGFLRVVPTDAEQQDVYGGRLLV